MKGFGDALTIDDAIARSAEFLRERLRSGKYSIASLGSDGAATFSDGKGHLFVVSFLAEAMAGLIDEIDRTIILVRIMSEEIDGSWGFSPPGARHRAESLVYHVDSDDTAYVLRTLRRLGVNRPPDALGRYYREPERLFVTFDCAAHPRLTTAASPSANFDAHLDVNANIYLALRGTHFDGWINFDMLRDAQDEAGYWASFFYPSRLFATTLVLDVVRDEPSFADAIARAVDYVLRTQNADGSWGTASDSYETALAVTILAGRPQCAEAMQRGVAYLLSAMAPDGSWASSARIWEFSFSEDDVHTATDVHRAYVSARCLTALRRAAGQLTAFP